MLKRFIVFSVCAVGLLLPLRAAGAIPEPVKLDAGLVTGVPGALPEVRVFKGIPFAAPPVGDLRWKAPQPPAPWSGVRAADKFSANCMQRRADGGAFPPYGGDRSATAMSEDCLYLNVYTTASATDRRPVMVWIHGGAWTSGAGAIYEGEELARKGVVVVTINYRLGVFGFLAHPELTKESAQHSSGDYAFLDQIAALKWVQKNIAALGGDPARVTIFGESAGSWSVNVLTASPLARGLFHRAIGESGGQFGIDRPLAAVERAGAQFADTAAAPTLKALRAMSADALQALRGFDTTAAVDGWVLPQSVADTFASGKQNDVPTIIGSNADEGSIFTNEEVTAASFRSQSERRYGATAREFLSLYPFSNDAEARRAQAASMRDSYFGFQMRTWARAQSRTGKSKVYLYYFSRVPPLENSAWLGAQHGAEIPYAFNWPSGPHTPAMSWTDVDRRLAEEVSSFWVNFAATGDPNRRSALVWLPYDAVTDRLMEFADQPKSVPTPNRPALDFLDRMAAPVAAGTAR